MMSFDGGFEFLGGLVGLALLRSGKQSIHGDLGLLGQVQRLVKRIVGFPETTLSVASTMDAAR